MKLKEINLNLDSYISTEQLQETGIELNNHPRLYADKYFHGQINPVKTVKWLMAYTWNKSTAMRLRTEGKIDIAIKYEKICEKIYNKLPDYAKW